MTYPAAAADPHGPPPPTSPPSPSARRDEQPDLPAYPAHPLPAQLLPRRVAVPEHPGPHPHRPLAVERVVAQQPQRRGVGLEQPVEERQEPGELRRRAEPEEPHAPVEPQVVGRELARPPPRRAGFAAEHVLLPVVLGRVGLPGALDDDLVPLAVVRPEGPVGAYDVKRCE